MIDHGFRAKKVLDRIFFVSQKSLELTEKLISTNRCAYERSVTSSVAKYEQCIEMFHMLRIIHKKRLPIVLESPFINVLKSKNYFLLLSFLISAIMFLGSISTDFIAFEVLKL